VKKIVFIHGVGDGVLKNELRRELGRKYPKYPYQDASFREYGFGATMAILKK
jgi:dsDNA-specific endonuclease/ATPase MutS2